MGTEYSAPFAGSTIATSQQYRDRYAPTQPDMIDADPTSNALQVSNNANTQVTIQMGSAIVQGALYQLTGSVHNLAVAANGGGSNRFDIVVLRYDASIPSVRLFIVQGTAGAGLPALTNSKTGIWDFPLAHYEKQPGGNIVNIVDRRKFTDYCGGVIGFTNGQFPPAPRVGYTLTTYPEAVTYRWSGTAWDLWDTGRARLTYTPSWTASTTNPSIGNGTRFGRYSVRGYSEVYFTCKVNFGTTTTYGSGGWRLSVPVTPLGPSNPEDIFGVRLFDDSTGQAYMGMGVISDITANTITVQGTADLDTVQQGTPVTFANLDSIRAYGQYESAA